MDFKSFRWKPVTLSVCMFISFLQITDAQNACNGVVVGNKCFTLRMQSKTFADASVICRNAGGTLASVSSEAEQNAVATLARRFGVNQAWIGLSTDDKLWRWLDGRITAAQGCFYESQSSTPSDRDLPEEVLPPISELSPERCIQACIARGFLYSATRNGARCFCGESFGRYNTSAGCTVRCTGNTTFSISNWCGGPFQNSVYYNYGAVVYFGYNQPNNFDLDQQCGIVDTNIEVKMADEKCVRTFSYLCDMFRDADDNCNGQGYYAVRGHCYYVGEEEVTWYEAQERCLARSGDLAVLADRELREEMHIFMDNMFPYAKKVWIGLKKGGYYWASGEPLIFDEWDVGFPSSNDINNCVMISSPNYKWQDSPCDVWKYFLCENVRDSGGDTGDGGSGEGGSGDGSSGSSGSGSESGDGGSSGSGSGSGDSGSSGSGSGSGDGGSSGSGSGSGDGGSSGSTSNTGSTSGDWNTGVSTGSGGSDTGSGHTTYVGVTTSPGLSPTFYTTADGDADLAGSTTSSHITETTTPLSSFNATTEGDGGNIPVAPPSGAAASTDEEGGISTMHIALAVVAAILLLLLIILGVCCMKYWTQTKGRRVKVNYVKGYDARPIADVPNSGHFTDYDVFASTIDLRKADPW